MTFNVPQKAVDVLATTAKATVYTGIGVSVLAALSLTAHTLASIGEAMVDAVME